MIGQTIGEEWLGDGHEVAANWYRETLKTFDKIYVRCQASVERLNRLGEHRSVLGFDPALLLSQVPRVESPHVVSIFVRHTDKQWLALHEEIARAVVDWSHSANYDAWLCACADDDLGFCQQLKIGDAVKSTGFKVDKAMRIISRSTLVVSIGRLHPVVLAYLNGVPSIAVPNFVHHFPDKIRSWCVTASVTCRARTPEAVVAELGNALDAAVPNPQSEIDTADRATRECVFGD